MRVVIAIITQLIIALITIMPEKATAHFIHDNRKLIFYLKQVEMSYNIFVHTDLIELFYLFLKLIINLFKTIVKAI